MATNLERFEQFGPEWNRRLVLACAGIRDSHIKTGEDYDTRSLGSLFTAEPGRKPKLAGWAVVPSTYHDYDGREHAAQRSRGEYVALTGDVDSGDHPMERIETLVRAFAGDAAWLIYSTAHARPTDMRWRVVIPLEASVDFTEWHDAQTAFFNFMEIAGVPVDRAMGRAAQIVYLPNVPAHHEKTGQPLRDDEDKPLYYQRASSGTNAPGLKLSGGSVAAGIASIRRQRQIDDEARERIRAEAERKRLNRPHTDNAQLIDDFNATTSIATMMELNGYKQSPRNAQDWCSPHQTSGSFATRIIGEKWVSLSASDASAGLGTRFSDGCYGDAYDLFVHYTHGGNHKAAFRQLHAERKSAEGSSAPKPERKPHPEPNAGQDAPDYEPDELAQTGAEDDGDPPLIVATPFTWRNPSDIPPRRWLYGRHLIRKFLSVDVAAGGIGKSSVKVVEALALASGRELLGKTVHDGPHTVWLYNLEDPDEETERRLHAALQRYSLDPREVDGRLYVNSGRDQPLIIAEETEGGARIARPVVDAIISQIRTRRIDVLMVDPFVSSHAVSENDNRAIDLVAKEWSRIADVCDCSINLVHHVRKQNGTEATAESSRGAISLIGAARSVIVYNRMTKEEGERAGIAPDQRGFFFRTQNDKANLAPPEAADWHRMNNVDLPNGDQVGVACSWDWPDSFDGLTTGHLKRVQAIVAEGEWRADVRSKEKWVGCAIADVCGLNADRDRHRIKDILAEWIKTDMLREVEKEDQHRKMRAFVEVGTWHTS